MKKKILLILILCLTTAGCSLYPDGSISGSDEKNVEVKEDNDTKHIQTIINSSVSVDIDVEDYKATALKELKAEYRNWSEQEMKDVVDLLIEIWKDIVIIIQKGEVILMMMRVSCQ